MKQSKFLQKGGIRLDQERYRVVYLVDNRSRDLAAACLISLHLERLNVVCYLEPLEAYRAALSTYRPHMIIFNHLLANHLVRYSQQLRDLGVLVAVLPNEGIAYEHSDLMFNAGKAHNKAHIDLFFAWNQSHRNALRATAFVSHTKVEVFGPPRFDLYFQPWANIYKPKRSRFKKPMILICTNFVFAKFADLPPVECEKFFMHWKVHIERYKDYWGAVIVSKRNRERLFSYLQPLAESALFEIILRVHPNEDITWYQQKLSTLDGSWASAVTLDSSTNITKLILDCDLEISMDSCTTALESWLAEKPTLDLDLERHPILSNPLLDDLNPRCSEPSEILKLVNDCLANPGQAEFYNRRLQHLETWCAAPRGDSAFKTARKIFEVLQLRFRTPAFDLNFSDKRRMLKLKILRSINKPYNWQPQMFLRSLYNPESTYIKRKAIEKSITPSDVSQQMALFRRVLPDELVS